MHDHKLALAVYERIEKLRPEWFEERKCVPEYDGTELDRDAVEIEKVKLVCTNGQNEPKELSDPICDSKYRKKLAKAFKDEKSNFKIAIVVDMWITGFDVPSLGTMYLDKPGETHDLIQTISRVNRAISSTHSGKEFNFDEQPTDDIQMLFSDDFIEKLKRIPYPNTRYQALVKLLKRAIKEFGKANMLKATGFSKRLKGVIER